MTNPIWLVKTRLALQQRTAIPGARPYKGMVDAFIKIGQTEGFRGYYKGLGPSLVLVSPIQRPGGSNLLRYRITPSGLFVVS